MLKKVIKTGILFILLCMVPLTSFAGNGKDEAEEKKNQAEEKKKEVEDLIQELETEKANTEAYILALDAEMAALDESISTAEAEIAQTEADIVVKQQELEEAKIEEETQYETMKARIKFMYENGDTAYVEALLQSQDLSELLKGQLKEELTNPEILLKGLSKLIKR